MRFNAGFITPKLAESRDFYVRVFGWRVDFENEFYVLLGSPDGQQLSFLLPDHPSQHPLFRPAFAGRGAYLTVEVGDVDRECARIRALGVPIAIELRDEPWGDRHFAVVDPNGIGVDVVTHTPPPAE